MNKLDLIMSLNGIQAKVYRQFLKSGDGHRYHSNIQVQLTDITMAQVKNACRSLAKKGLIYKPATAPRLTYWRLV